MWILIFVSHVSIDNSTSPFSIVFDFDISASFPKLHRLSLAAWRPGRLLSTESVNFTSLSRGLFELTGR